MPRIEVFEYRFVEPGHSEPDGRAWEEIGAFVRRRTTELGAGPPLKESVIAAAIDDLAVRLLAGVARFRDAADECCRREHLGCGYHESGLTICRWREEYARECTRTDRRTLAIRREVR